MSFVWALALIVWSVTGNKIDSWMFLLFAPFLVGDMYSYRLGSNIKTILEVVQVIIAKGFNNK